MSHRWLWSVGVLLAMSLSRPVLATEPACKVIDPELQGSYQGACVGGLAQGEGVAEGTARYVGGFASGKKDGRGVKTWPNGDRYEGAFRNDMRHGIGTYIWGEGSSWKGERYQGSYVEDKREGFGVYQWPNGDRYVGQWRDDAMLGPLTPMQTQQVRHDSALAESMAESGTQVCRIAGPGKTAEFTARGKVQKLSGRRLTVRLTDSLGKIGARREPADGEVVEEAVQDWRPCY